MNNEHGLLNGEICNRNGCKGIVFHEPEGCCSCHLNPPCSFCTDDGAVCFDCGWENRREYIQQKSDPMPVKQTAPPEIQDDGKLYSVERYFDDIWEATTAKNLTLPAASKKCDEMNNLPRHYVSYRIREQKIFLGAEVTAK